jgi:C-terminal processing protease CtpA/Prc
LSDKITIEEGIDVAVGDCIIVIKEDGSIGQVILPEVNSAAEESKGYKLTLDILEYIDNEKGALIRSETNRRKYN